METMLRVRAAFDPTGLCNPGKIIPMLRGCGEARAVSESGALAKGSVASEASGAEMREVSSHRDLDEVPERNGHSARNGSEIAKAATEHLRVRVPFNPDVAESTAGSAGRRRKHLRICHLASPHPRW